MSDVRDAGIDLRMPDTELEAALAGLLAQLPRPARAVELRSLRDFLA